MQRKEGFELHKNAVEDVVKGLESISYSQNLWFIKMARFGYFMTRSLWST